MLYRIVQPRHSAPRGSPSTTGHEGLLEPKLPFLPESPMLSPSVASPARWVQLLPGLVVMMAISSPQYVWTLFVKSFQAATGAGLPTVQITFSLLIVCRRYSRPRKDGSSTGSGRRYWSLWARR